MMDTSHNRVYSAAHFYDVAFNFRDIGAECDVLAALAQRHGNGAPRTVLELAAGPARHAREWARRGTAATALDSSAAMCEYALECAARDGLSLQVVVADMVDFSLGQRFDLTVMPMDSSSYLLDNAAALKHLDSVARHLVDGGLYVLEMTHPRTAFGVGASTGTDWISEADGIRVHTCWGAVGDAFDPITQIDEVTVTMAWSGHAGEGRLQERARQRRFTANEVDALVRASGQFEIVEWLGSLARATAFSNDPAAVFMVPVLRKRTAARC
jgi:SAM-dependent methyltransferase